MTKTIFTTALLLSAVSMAAAETSPATTIQTQDTAATHTQRINDIPTMNDALQHIQTINPPSGVTFVGSADMLKTPTIEQVDAAEADQDKNKEQWLGGWGGLGLGHGFHGFHGLGGWGGWGGWPGWSGVGPWRFGFQCGGMPGWAYPLPYWNLWGAGLYGGSCGLGLAYGGLYYC